MADFSPLIIIGGLASGFSILVVWLIYGYIMPARNSPAWTFIKAKKQKLPVVLLDAGGFWKLSVGQNELPGSLEDNEGSKVDITPGSMKWCVGVRVGVGEYNRSVTTDPFIVKLIAEARKQKLNAENVKKAWEYLEKEEGVSNVAEEEQPTADTGVGDSPSDI